MFEVEMKVKVKNYDELKDILDNRTIQGDPMENFDLYFNHTSPERDFSKTDEAIRIRVTKVYGLNDNKIKSETADLTYKGPKLDAQIKTRVENVVSFDPKDIKPMESILKVMNLKKVIEIRKKRLPYTITYQNYDIEIVLDEIEYLPRHYMELEIQCKEKEETTKAKEVMISLLNEFGYSIEDSIRDSYLELIVKQLAKKS